MTNLWIGEVAALLRFGATTTQGTACVSAFHRLAAVNKSTRAACARQVQMSLARRRGDGVVKPCSPEVALAVTALVDVSKLQRTGAGRGPAVDDKMRTVRGISAFQRRALEYLYSPHPHGPACCSK